MKGLEEWICKLCLPLIETAGIHLSKTGARSKLGTRQHAHPLHALEMYMYGTYTHVANTHSHHNTHTVHA